MLKKITNILSVILLVMFVNFSFSNIIFMHTHVDENNIPITHSHPYLPNTGHTHSSSSLSLIDTFNISASAFFKESLIFISRIDSTFITINCFLPYYLKKQTIFTKGERAPPILNFIA